MSFVRTGSNRDYFTTMNACFKKMSFDDKVSPKMEKLYELSSLTSRDYEMRNELRKYIMETLRKYYPHCRVHIYGSSNNGFGSTGCDLDLLFLPYPEYLQLGTENDDNELLPTLEQVASGVVRKTDLLEMGEKSQLLFAKQVFETESTQFHNVVFVPAKCPIINFIFIWKGSRFVCDLSCQDRLVLYNTGLLKVFGIVDRRVMPLVSTLCYWAKHLKCIQVLNLSTYAFTLMIIFFLQRVDPPVLPSADFLMDVAGSSKLIAECKVGYAYDINKVPKSENKSTNEELLTQFFVYYWNFDFNKNIICVRTGSALPIRCMEETFQDRCKNFEITAVCIQDPFKLFHNVSRNLNHKGLRNFKLSFHTALKILGKIVISPLNKCRFDRFFDDSNYKELIRDCNSVASEGSISFIIDLDYEITSGLENVENAENAERSCYYIISEAVLQILDKGLLFDCEVIDKTKSPLGKDTLHPKDDQYSTSNETDVNNSTLKDMDSILSIKCAVKSRTWIARKTVTEKLLQLHTEEFSNIIEKEEYISKHIAAVPKKGVDLTDSTPFFSFICHCYQSKFPQIPCLIIELAPLTNSKEFKSMAGYLSTFIPKTLHKYFSA